MQTRKQLHGVGGWLAAWAMLGVVSAGWAQVPRSADGGFPSSHLLPAPPPFILSPAVTNGPADNAGLADLTNVQRERMYEAMTDVQQGRDAEAIPKLEQLVNDAPHLTGAWQTLGWAYWRKGRQGDALALWEKLQRLDPSLPLAHNLLGAAHVARNEITQAVACYERSLQLHPDQYEIRFTLARIQRWTGDLDRAIETFRVLRAKDPQRVDVEVELARALLDNRQFEEATPLWAELFQLNPTNQEYMTRQAAVLLSKGELQKGEELANRILQQNPTNVYVYALLANAAERGAQPAEAIKPLRKIIEVAGEGRTRHDARVRLIRLLVRLNKKTPLQYALNEPIALTRDVLREEPSNVDAHLLLGELLQMDQRFEDAERQFLHVLKLFNPHNQRARRGLFEAYLALRRFKEAEQQYKIIASFNPRDPYLFYRQARLAEAQGKRGAALRALDQLERAGSRGAVAVLLFHGLTTSEWLDIPSVSQFQSQLQALKKAGFRFITPEQIPAYFDGLEKNLDVTRGTVPERVVCVTFDDARRDAMRLGTEIARQMNVKLAMHVPVGNVERGDPFLCSWDQLKGYQATGQWVLGSHLMYASDVLPVSADKQPGYPLANRLWLEPAGRLETEAEYLARLQVEYRRSREILEQKLGQPVTFMAYPMGDIGQETLGNVSDAVAANLAAAGANYSVGFIQSPFGYAVNGDNPLLYQRHELERGLWGDEVVYQLIDNHPFFMARRMRIEMAALNGKVHEARAALEQLKQDGYPEPLWKKLNIYVSEHLAGQFAAPTKTETVQKGPLYIEPANPYVGVQGEYFRDNLDSRIWRAYGLGGLNLTPNLALEGRAGFGQMKQPFTNSTAANIPSIKLDEKMVGLAPSFTFPNGWVLMGEITDRMLSGDAPTNQAGAVRHYDKDFLVYAAEAQAKPLLPLDMTLRWEHDLVPAARAVVKDTTYNLAALNAVYSLFDWWDLWGSGQRYWFSDSNTRDHAQLISSWLVYEPVGLHLGLGYAFATSSDANADYWTPYNLNRYFAEAALRGNWLRTYYNLRLRYGIGKQSIRPEANEQYQADLKRSQTEHWGQAAINDLIANKPESSWQPVFGASASMRMHLGENWEINGEISYNKVPDYNEVGVIGGVKFKF